MAHSSLMFQAFRSLLTVSFQRNFGLPLGRFPSIFILTTARMFSVSSLQLKCPNHSSVLLLMTVAVGTTFASSNISSFLLCSNRLTPIAHRTILIYVVAIWFSYLSGIGHVSQQVKQHRSNHCLVYRKLQSCWNVLVANHSTQFPFLPCLCSQRLCWLLLLSSVDPKYLKD